MDKLKVLFFAEGATLAHVARPMLLAAGLDNGRFDAILCRPEGFAHLTQEVPCRQRPLNSQSPSIFTRRLEGGKPLYDYPTLCRYVEEDLALIDACKPDVVVGDFRLTLSVSARLRKVPYITICDAYWSPELPIDPPLPALWLTRYLPLVVATRLFRIFSPFAFRMHAVPMERLRRLYGLPSFGYDLRRCYTDADLRLFANFRSLFPDLQPHEQADFLGPLAWSPKSEHPIDLPEGDGPIAYLTMGSSGDPAHLATIIPVLQQSGFRTLVATAGKPLNCHLDARRTRVNAYLPGEQVCQMANLVVCNGGSPTTNQALAAGVPVIGVASNMDQFLNMRAIERAGAGVLLRADRLTTKTIDDCVQRLLSAPSFREQAARLKGSAEGSNYSQILTTHILRLTGRPSV